MITVNGKAALAQECTDLANEVETALKQYATYNHPKYGTIYAFEVDGFGNHLLMDDANVPSLLALAYLGDVDVNDPIYQNTRRFVWSEDNPYFFRGKDGEGIGGPHIGYDMAWPMSVMMKAFTSRDDAEIKWCIEMLMKTDADTGYKLYTTSDNDPNKNYYECFVTTPYYNDEYILTRSVWNTYEIELFLAPCGFSGTANSTGRTNPTQNLVDSYETINGLPIDQDPTYNDQNPYANRDPRLAQTILHHGSIWGDPLQEEQRAVDISYPDGKDYQELHGGTLTGYYTKKFLNNMS